MNIEIRNVLSTNDIKNIEMLMNNCFISDKIQYTPYLGEEGYDDDIFILAFEKKLLVGMLCCFNSDIPEASIYVHPDFRRTGIASSLLKKLPFKRFVLTGKDFSPGYAEFANAVGFNASYHEFLMKFNNSEIITDKPIAYTYKNNCFTYTESGIEIACCSIYEESNTINIYDIYVAPKYRRQGYGRKLLSTILNELISSGKQIILQVSELNTPAYNLYLSLGFEVTDSVLYHSNNQTAGIQ